MKKAILIILFLALVTGCGPDMEETVDETAEESVEETGSKCDSYSEGPRKILCYAMEAEDITMCADIEGRFREECVVVLAEIVQDRSLVEHCSISEVPNNQKICRALILEDVDKCFDWPAGSGLGDSLAVRDCIDLTSRKTRSPESCGLFETRSTQINTICGQAPGCEGQWIDGAADHASDCRYAVEEAMQAG